MNALNLAVDLAPALSMPAAASKLPSKPASSDFADRMRRAMNQPSQPEKEPAKPAKPSNSPDQHHDRDTSETAGAESAPGVLELAMQAIAGQQGHIGTNQAATEQLIERAIESLAGKVDQPTLMALLANAAAALDEGGAAGKKTVGDLAKLLQTAAEQQAGVVGNAVVTLTAGAQSGKPALDMHSLLTMLRLQDQATPPAPADPNATQTQQTPAGLLAMIAQTPNSHAQTGTTPELTGRIVESLTATDANQPARPKTDTQPAIVPLAPHVAATAVDQAKPLAETAVTPRQVVDQLAAPINARLDAGGSSEFQVTLRPESLGTVGITVKVEHGAVHVQLVVDDHARDLVQAGLPDLRNAIRQNDSRDLQVDVMLRSGGGFDGGPYSRGSQQQDTRPRGGRGIAALDTGMDAPIDEPQQAASPRAAGLGLVDYRI